ncbi:hypothetical protein [Bacillus infantis]|uniref:hypothetical protein n=1 Tax=Bacillus infantis TaxID=324767 RepID=UPI003CE7D1E6
MDKQYCFVVIMQNYLNESIHEIQSVCLTRETANKECERLQQLIDPEYNKWKFVYESMVDLIN